MMWNCVWFSDCDPTSTKLIATHDDVVMFGFMPTYAIGMCTHILSGMCTELLARGVHAAAVLVNTQSSKSHQLFLSLLSSLWLGVSVSLCFSVCDGMRSGLQHVGSDIRCG